MTRKPRSRPLPDWLPDWLRDLPAAVAAEKACDLLPDMDAGWLLPGPYARQLAAGAGSLISIAMTQAEKLPYPGPLTMMMETLIDAEPQPWPEGEGPTAQKVTAGWAGDMAQLIDNTSRNRGNQADCRRAMVKSETIPAKGIAPLILPITRAMVCGWFTVALMRRAFATEEANRRLGFLLALLHSLDQMFWADHGGWPWRPVKVCPQQMFLAREQVAASLGANVGAAGRA
ncbi:hypothetical protein [Niveispirillum fermenti]|uniref:hypothetical protein n=1 Tax=Niveispirillum fermenti TaxID=1233113 RepID=UPI003A87DEC7